MKTNLLAAASSLVIVLLLQGLPAGAQSTDIPSEARKHFVMGTTLYKDAKTQSDFAEAAAEYLQAANLAPQWTEARNNTAAMFESAGDYAKAIENLKIYQQFKLPDAEAQAVQEKIWGLEAKQKKAEKNKEQVAQKAAEEKAKESSPEAVAERQKNKDQELIKSLNGAKYVFQEKVGVGDEVVLRFEHEFVIRGTTLVQRRRLAYKNTTAPTNPVGQWEEPIEMQIVGRKAERRFEMFYQKGGSAGFMINTFIISEDANSITWTTDSHEVDGSRPHTSIINRQ